jgi:hypothetical protein
LPGTEGFFGNTVILSSDGSGVPQAQWCRNSYNQNNPNNCCFQTHHDSLVMQHASGSGERFNSGLK